MLELSLFDQFPPLTHPGALGLGTLLSTVTVGHSTSVTLIWVMTHRGARKRVSSVLVHLEPANSTVLTIMMHGLLA